MTIKILIPCNFTENDQKAIQHVRQRYENEEQVEITLFHAYSPVPEIDVLHDPVMEKMKASVTYLRQLKEDHRKELEQIKLHLVEYGFKSNRIHTCFEQQKEDVALDIINLWKREKYDVVVLTRNPGSIVNYFSRSTSKRLIRYNNGKINVQIVN